MQKPRITLFVRGNLVMCYNKEIQSYYTGSFNIKTVLHYLSIVYLCQKDEQGNYRTDLDIYKPKFD